MRRLLGIEPAQPLLHSSTMHGVSDSGPFDDDDVPEGFDFSSLFGGAGAGGDPQAMLSQFMQLFGGMSGGGLDHATQVAISVATGAKPENNVDPVERMALEQLVRVAELQVGEATGLRTSTSGPLTISAVTKTDWVRKSMQAYKPLLEKLAESMSPPDLGSEYGSDPQMAMFQQLMGSMRPMMVGLTSGSMVGHLGARALGTYDLPLPRTGADEILVVASNLNDLGEEWSLDPEALRLWLALSEVTFHAVLSISHVGERIEELIGRYTSAFDNNPKSIAESFGDIDASSGDFGAIQQQIQEMFGDPTEMLLSMRSDQQLAILPEIATLMAPIVGYVDHIMDRIGASLIPSYPQITEALRRRRVTTSESDRFVERLLGLELDQDLYDRGAAFVDGVHERAGNDGLARLWQDPESLPTANEIAAPGLWLSRMEIDFEVEIDPAELAALDDFLENPEEE